LFFDLQPKFAHINDANAELMNVYCVIRDHVEELVSALKQHENTSEYFYRMRELDREKDKYNVLSCVERASRIIYLNKTCYNGLFRVNNAGEFNAPFGNYTNPNIVNEMVLRAVSHYLANSSVQMTSMDYSAVLGKIKKKKTFVYLDPPYDPVSATASFTGYTKNGFSREAQIQLRKHCDALTDRGIKFMLSNSDTEFIREQYACYHITEVRASRQINSVSSKRGDVDELVIRNYHD